MTATTGADLNSLHCGNGNSLKEVQMTARLYSISVVNKVIHGTVLTAPIHPIPSYSIRISDTSNSPHEHVRACYDQHGAAPER